MVPHEELPTDPTSLNQPSCSANQDDRARIIQSVDVLQGHQEVWIEHGDEMYRLRVTSSGKLYLTK